VDGKTGTVTKIGPNDTWAEMSVTKIRPLSSGPIGSAKRDDYCSHSAFRRSVLPYTSIYPNREAPMETIVEKTQARFHVLLGQAKDNIDAMTELRNAYALSKMGGIDGLILVNESLDHVEALLSENK
jgi:hypothetical protein